MLSGAREKKSRSDDGKYVAKMDGVTKEKAVFGVPGAPLNYTREVGSAVSGTSNRKAHYVSVYEEVVHFWGKGS